MLHSKRRDPGPEVPDHTDYTAKKRDTDTWEDGRNGGLLGISDLLLRAHVMATYLSHDWGRDWGRCASSTPSSMPSQLSWNWAPRPAVGCGSRSDPDQSLIPVGGALKRS